MKKDQKKEKYMQIAHNTRQMGIHRVKDSTARISLRWKSEQGVCDKAQSKKVVRTHMHRHRHIYDYSCTGRIHGHRQVWEPTRTHTQAYV